MIARAHVLGFLLLGAVLVAVPLTADNEYELRLFMLFLIYGLIALGLNVLVGLTGLVSLGQAGLFALGSYTAAILATRLGLDLAGSMVAAMLMASAFGVLLAYPTVRVRGVYLAVVTIAFGIIVENVAIEWQSLTGGTTGISTIPKPSVLGFPLGGYGYYGVLAVLLFATTVLAHNLRLSRFGRAMIAVAQSETASRSLGISPTATRTLAFAISAATAGAAGALYAFLNSYISPDIFTFADSVRFLLMVILGGAATTFGPVIGAFVLTYLPEYLQGLQLWQTFAYGALLAVVMFVLPRGIVGSLAALVERLFPGQRHEEAATGLPVADAVARPGHGPAPALTVDGVTVRFGGLVALSEVSLRVGPGEIHALIGPNGAGKSTLVNAITGFYQADTGRVGWGDLRVSGRRPHEVARLGIARTFQNTELFGDMTVAENVTTGFHDRFRYNLVDALLRTGRFRREEARFRKGAIGLLGFVGLAAYANERAKALPFGLQRRLEIARALASGPHLLLLDEPAAGLTTQEIEELDGMIRRIAALGISVLLIEHHVELIMSVADTVTVLDYGQVIASDSPGAVQSDPRVIEAYFGSGGALAAAPVAAAP
jgi:ABC-type branched-subunit amino acid transport system ATPase component/ABC-type branched-subunit amino acid transport system permease subunit